MKKEYEMDLLESFPELIPKLNKIGYEIGSMLGSGTKGSAYQLSNGRVLKVTTDVTEAEASAVLIGKSLKNVINVFKVFMFKNLPQRIQDEEDLFFIEEQKLNNIQCGNNLAVGIIGNRVDKISYDQKDISFEEIIKQIEKILKGNARAFIKKNEKLIKDLYGGANELKSVGIKFDDYIGCNVGMNNGNYVIFDLGYSKSPVGQIDIVEQRSKRVDPRLIRIFKNNEIIVYLVDGEIVRRDFDVEFTSGGNAGRYPKFTPISDIWVESTLNDKDKLFNAAREIVERHLMLFNNVNCDVAHAKASKYELAIRKKEVEDPIKFAIDTVNLCKINWFYRQSQRSGGLWPGFLCDGQVVDLEQFSNRCMGKCAESKIYCPICGKMMYQLKDGQKKKFTGFFDSHKLSENVENWISEEMIEWFEERTKKHISLVQKYCDKIYKYDPDRFDGIIERGKEHDSSKYGGIERNPYIIISWNYKSKDKGTTLEFPKYIKDKLNEATLHHITTNQHHPDYWSPRKTSLLNNNDRDKPPEKIVDATAMDDLSICEMCCDWLGMSDEKGSDVVEWAKNNINRRWKFTKDQEKLIWEIINAGIND
jgi:hypothetical protein